MVMVTYDIRKWVGNTDDDDDSDDDDEDRWWWSWQIVKMVMMNEDDIYANDYDNVEYNNYVLQWW